MRYGFGVVLVWFVYGFHSFSSGNVLVWSWYVFDIVLEWSNTVQGSVYFCLGLIQFWHGFGVGLV